MFEVDFAGRVLAFASDAAAPYARIATDRRRVGNPIAHFDAQIAAIAVVHGARVATRDVDDFAGVGSWSNARGPNREKGQVAARMIDLYPSIEPYDRGMLAVGDGNAIAWEVSGAARGKPAVVLHGGPGQGSAPNMRRAFDPTRYRVVLYDQRGCGQSVPHASEPTTTMAVNTTDHLIADLEALRVHLGIDRWLVSAGSWGCTLALAYAERYPEHVSEIVLTSVTTFRRVEREWLYRGIARFFPAEWERFRNHVPEALRDDVVNGYAKRMEHADAEVRLRTARAWCAWEDAVLSLEPGARQSGYADLAERDVLAFVRICTHYLRHAAWLEEGALIRDAHRLAGIPGVIIHGRRDMACPFETAWELGRAWSGAELVALSDAGHLRTESRRLALLRAFDKFAR